MMDIVVGVLLVLLLISMALLIICPLYWMFIDNYYFSVRAVSLKQAYKKARRYANESCMTHEYIDYISLL